MEQTHPAIRVRRKKQKMETRGHRPYAAMLNSLPKIPGNTRQKAKTTKHTRTTCTHDIFVHHYLCNVTVVDLNSILSIKNGNDNVRIEDNCLEEELATTPILSEIRTLSLTFVMLMRFFARLNIYYKTFLTRMQCDTTPFTSCCHNVDFCIAFLRQSANNYRHCSFCAQISPVVLKNKQ
jgi:hypothetical protein